LIYEGLQTQQLEQLRSLTSCTSLLPFFYPFIIGWIKHKVYKLYLRGRMGPQTQKTQPSSSLCLQHIQSKAKPQNTEAKFEANKAV